MPAYNSLIPAPSTSRGIADPLWTAETPTPGNGTTAASQQYGMVSRPGVLGTPFSVHGKFSGAPGVFEIDVQVADTDSDTEYQTISGGLISTVDSTNNTFHFDATTTNARFMRLLMRSRTNSVSITATVTAG